MRVGMRLTQLLISFLNFLRYGTKEVPPFRVNDINPFGTYR